MWPVQRPASHRTQCPVLDVCPDSTALAAEDGEEAGSEEDDRREVDEGAEGRAVITFALVVAYLGGVVTGGMLVFFARGPLVAFFQVKDEPPDRPVYVEMYAPTPDQRRHVRGRGRPWNRVATRTPSRLPVLSRAELERLGGGPR